MPTLTAGIILYRRIESQIEILIGHFGGPYYARKDDGGWTFPKGVVEPGEDLLAAAHREWTEETGTPPPTGAYLPLAPVRQKSGKLNHLFVVAGDVDATTLNSNTCTIEWPPRSGKRLEIPEVDRFAWVDLPTAERKLTPGLAPVVQLVVEALRVPS